ncbi:hypothetical protein [Microcoleus sp. D2_18a_D3]|uniref:hypothetical protein n=1 Tax=Microcoleus sp. D2_18a_D3 TaxID=3055330 RepID=UPI002FD40DE3
MTGQKFDRIVAIAALLVGFVGVIPAVYSFQDNFFCRKRIKQTSRLNNSRIFKPKESLFYSYLPL